MTNTSYIVFTDLDGTLLDHNSYSFTAANEALQYLRENNIPLMLVSRKTRPEMEYYQDVLNITGLPYVVENGSAIYTSPGYFAHIPGYHATGTSWCYQLGQGVSEIIDIIEKISNKYKYQIKGFHNSSKEEIANRTGLKQEQVEYAMKREYSIPVYYDEKSETLLKKEIDKYNLSILYGGRFMHLLGNVNKGDALCLILKGYQQKYPGKRLRTIAIGDSLNDFDMLKEADYSILVKKTTGNYEDRDQLPNVRYSPGIGPAGWNSSILEIIKSGENNE